MCLKPAFFLKDVLFYLGAVTVVLSSLLLGRAYLWMCALLLAAWVTYVCLTVYLSRDEERVQLDPLHHEVR